MIRRKRKRNYLNITAYFFYTNVCDSVDQQVKQQLSPIVGSLEKYDNKSCASDKKTCIVNGFEIIQYRTITDKARAIKIPWYIHRKINNSIILF